MIGMSAAHTHVGPKLDMVVALLSRQLPRVGV